MEKKQKNSAKVEGVIRAFRENGGRTDPLGMYTGNVREVQGRIDNAIEDGKVFRALSEKEKKEMQPVQDADDL